MNQIVWQHSNRCEGGACVEVGQAPDSPNVYVRNPKDPNGPILTFTPKEWEAFRLGVLDGEFTY